jgi:hypothetical protein
MDLSPLDKQAQRPDDPSFNSVKSEPQTDVQSKRPDVAETKGKNSALSTRSVEMEIFNRDDLTAMLKNLQMLHSNVKKEEPEVSVKEDPKVSVKQEPEVSVKEESRLSAAFANDITIPDGFSLPPNARFCKIWEFYNDGNVIIPKDATLRFTGGESFGASKAQPIGHDVLPGEKFTVGLGHMEVPNAPGSQFLGTYGLFDVEGKPFGDRFWVE